MLSTKKPDLEPIPGYRLLEPLGKGGFGEVWKCEAPGGLFKAIKFVHGTGATLLDSVCPSSEEMQAIQRIKALRHPFLLSIERVERCGEELVIVMELADRSLADLLAANPTGLPRYEVLSYLREAAEVLDLMNFEYGLQHLDVKPRNLFLVHGHVKVADFGLVQSLSDTTRLDGGLSSQTMDLNMVTPLYSAPELFQSRISERCDQYSLAIVYQELLTGKRPIDGKNARQLMMLHTVGQPNLEPLPDHDRPIIARALEKDPRKRFGSCMEMVRALNQVSAAGRQASPVGRLVRPRPSAPGRGQSGHDTRTNVGATQLLGPAEARALPDYEFVNCLGRDPRGETWEVRSPEGQPKLVHVLYGTRHDPESLAHLQTLRHPALVPMAIIPAGPGSLLLVTDPTGTSLRDRYLECQARGEAGLPRGRLLDVIEQAAETLDQLYQQHGLQHLELNPARLLLAGDRVLLERMGVAQVVWSTSSVASGQAQLRYTAPERTLGLTTRSCDQYSLAVIYQEMLTGKHPFRAPTTGRPSSSQGRAARVLDLQPLPAAEQAVVARALDPDPERRFGSCLEFVRALRAAGASVAPSAAPVVPVDPARAARQQQIAKLVEEARQWLRLQQGETPATEPVSTDELRGRFVAVLPPGAALRKFETFLRQWDARVLEEGEGFANFAVPEKSRSWLPWRGKAGLRVEVRWPKSNAAGRKMPEVVVRILPASAQCKASAALLSQVGPLVLESMQASLLGSPERRNGERVLWPHPVEVACVSPGRPRGQVLECQGKDVSLTGLGLYMPSSLPGSQVQLSLRLPSSDETLTLPGSIVRIQRWDDKLFEVGVIFE